MYGQSTGASEANQFASLASSQVAGPPNRWRGRNRAGWSNREFDELAEAFSSTLDNQERIGQRIRAAKLVSDELPQVMLFWNLNPEVLVSKVKGPVQTAMLATGGESWNIHEWEMR
jgi:ABC-type transport system substrate-binding protein